MKLVLRCFVVGLLALGGGCGTDEVMSGSPQFLMNEAKLSSLARYQSGPLKITVAFAAKTIGPEGGSIRILGFEAIVPPGAVKKATRFTIRLPIDPQNSEYVRAEFGPHGETFAVPVTLRLPLKGTTAEGDESVNVLWWDGARWVPFPTRATVDGRIETTTTHFSEYGTEDSTNRGIILGNRPCARSCTK